MKKIKVTELLSIAALLAVAFSSSVARGQDVTGLNDFIQSILRPPAIVLTVTAAQGDGTTCTAAKAPGPAINLTLNCVNGASGAKSTSLRSTSSGVQSLVWGYGDVLCLLLVNPTAVAVAAAGSFPAVPAVSVGYQCTTVIRTAGVYAGNTAPVSGSVSWP